MSSVAAEQVRMRELLEDPIYRAWIAKVPSLDGAVCYSGKPWRVWVKPALHGRWLRRDHEDYKTAYYTLVSQIAADWHDAAITCKVKAFRPPVVRDKSLGLVKHAGRMVGKKRYHIPAVVGQSALHEWCEYCRRPTIFATFKKHHTFGQTNIAAYVRRCAVCGIRLSAVRPYR